MGKAEGVQSDRSATPAECEDAGERLLERSWQRKTQQGWLARTGGAHALAMTSQGAVGVGKIGGTDHQAPPTGVFGTPQPCAAFSLGEGASCSFPLVSLGYASLSIHEKGVLREVNAIIRAVNWLFGAASGFRVSYYHWESHRHAELLRRIFLVHRFSPPVSPFSPKAALVRLLRGRAEDPRYFVQSESSSAEGSVAFYQRTRLSRPTSTLGCPNLVDLISSTAQSFRETNMQKRGAQGQRSLAWSRRYIRGPNFAWEPIGLLKVCQRSIALWEHEGYCVTD